MSRFQDVLRDKAHLEAEAATRPPRYRAQPGKPVAWYGMHQQEAWPQVLSGCCQRPMSLVRFGATRDILLWVRPSGWLEYAPGRFRMTGHAKSLLHRKREVRSPRRVDHPYNLNSLPLVLDCPQCGEPNRLADFAMPRWAGEPWRARQGQGLG